MTRSMSRFFESIRVENGKAGNLRYHAKRVMNTIRAVYGTQPGWDLAESLRASRIPERRLFKCRVVYDHAQCSIEFDRYTIRTIRTLKLVTADDLEYSHKYIDRTALDNLFAMRAGCDEVLIMKRGRISDTSVANIILQDNKGEWCTPSDCLLKGTMRQSLLNSGRIFEMSLGIADLGRFKKFKLINAMRDWDAPGGDVSDIIE